jgi:hypothetical protein
LRADFSYFIISEEVIYNWSYFFCRLVVEYTSQTLCAGLHILTQNRSKKPLTIVLNGTGRERSGRDSAGELTSV